MSAKFTPALLPLLTKVWLKTYDITISSILRIVLRFTGPFVAGIPVVKRWFCAGWIAAMLLLFKWWTQLQSKASNSETVTLLEDTTDPSHSSQYSFVSATEHHSRHHSPLLGHNALDEEGLIEQRSSGLDGSETSLGSSSSRGVLPGLSKRRRLPTSAVTPLLGQCCFISLSVCCSLRNAPCVLWALNLNLN